MRAPGALGRLNRDSFPHFVRIVFLLAAEPFWASLCHGSAWWWRIELGSKNSFVGRVSFARARGSTISIGSGGRFLSATTSNRHGLSRPCMITTLKPGAVLRIGDQVGFSAAVICAAMRVEIGDRVMLGANTTVTDSDSHPIHFADRHPQTYGHPAHTVETEVAAAPVIIESDVFIGMHSIVLKGVTIGRGAVVGAGSVVSQSLPPYCIAAGNPARPIRYLKGHAPATELEVKPS